MIPIGKPVENSLVLWASSVRPPHSQFRVTKHEAAGFSLQEVEASAPTNGPVGEGLLRATTYLTQKMLLPKPKDTIVGTWTLVLIDNVLA